MHRFVLAALLFLLPALGPAAEPAAPKAAKYTPAQVLARVDYLAGAKKAVEPYWTAGLRPANLSPGNLTGRFVLDAQGKLTKFAVSENTSGNAAAIVLEAAVQAATFAPPPPALLANGAFSGELHFTVPPPSGKAADAAPAAAAPEKQNAEPANAANPGNYKRLAKLIVADKWTRAVKQHQDLLTKGTVSCAYTLNAQGKLTAFRITNNTSNQSHAMIVETAMRETKFPPPPPEMLKNGEFTDDFNFTIY